MIGTTSDWHYAISNMAHLLVLIDLEARARITLSCRAVMEQWKINLVGISRTESHSHALWLAKGQELNMSYIIWIWEHNEMPTQFEK